MEKRNKNKKMNAILYGSFFAVLENKKTRETKLLHEVLVEENLGRKLYPDEEIIFLNGNPLDCRDKNLKLVKKNKGDKNE